MRETHEKFHRKQKINNEKEMLRKNISAFSFGRAHSRIHNRIVVLSMQRRKPKPLWNCDYLSSVRNHDKESDDLCCRREVNRARLLSYVSCSCKLLRRISIYIFSVVLFFAYHLCRYFWHTLFKASRNHFWMNLYTIYILFFILFRSSFPFHSFSADICVLSEPFHRERNFKCMLLKNIPKCLT